MNAREEQVFIPSKGAEEVSLGKRMPSFCFSMVEKIISGGQMVGEEAALDAALEFGLSCGGWGPQGRRAEGGIIPDRYPTQETSSPAYQARPGLEPRQIV